MYGGFTVPIILRWGWAMHKLSFLVFLVLFGVISTVAQDSPPRDMRAVAILQQSVAAMGGAAPADSVASGRITIVAGSKTDAGTIRILSRGLNQSAEEIQTPEGTRALAYSRKAATKRAGPATKPLPLELAVSSHSPNFPLALLAEGLNDPNSAFEYVGLETIDSLPAHHVRFWKVFSNPKLQHLSQFSSKDIWIDASSFLPRKLFYVQRAARGSAAGISVEITFANYRNVGRALYPFSIRKSLNGTPWATITIESVALNTGLTDGDFPVRQGARP